MQSMTFHFDEATALRLVRAGTLRRASVAGCVVDALEGALDGRNLPPIEVDRAPRRAGSGRSVTVRLPRPWLRALDHARRREPCGACGSDPSLSRTAQVEAYVRAWLDGVGA